MSMLVFHYIEMLDFPGGSDSNESAFNAGNPGLIPGLGRSPGEVNGYSLLVFLPVEFHWLSSLMGYSPWDHKESDTTERLTLSLSYRSATIHQNSIYS